MKKSFSLVILASAFVSGAFAAEGDVSTRVGSTTIRTDVVDVQSCAYTPSVNANGQLIASATVNYLECVESETYQQKVTQGKYWSESVERVAGSERRVYQLVRRQKTFTDYNSMINNGYRTQIDPDLNGDGVVTRSEQREAREIQQDERIGDVVGDVARTALGHVQVMTECNNFVSQLHMVKRSNNNLPIECRR